MPLLDRLEARFSRFAIPGLIRYVMAFNALIFLLEFVNPGYASLLALDPAKILDGQVWRLVTYIFIPEASNAIFVAIAIMFFWYVGDRLEAAWGAFRLNLFYFTGMFFSIVAAFFLGGSGTYLNLSLLLAFATLFPDEEILFMFILPLKMKWLAWVSVVLLAVGALALPLSAKAGIVVSLFNYFLFFGPEFFRNRLQRRVAIVRKAKFEEASIPESSAMHRCSVCGRTDLSNPRLDFRVASDGNDYCLDHLPKKTATT